MTLGRLLDQIRESYLCAFSTIAQQQAGRTDSHLITEAVIVDAGGQPITEGSLDLPMREDLAVRRKGKVIDSIMVDAGKLVSFGPIEFQWRQRLTVSFYPMQWHAIPCVLHEVSRQVPWKPLTDWFNAAFGDPQLTGDGQSFLGVAHYLSDPEFFEGTAKVAMDLGSAPVTCFEQMLDAFLAMGVARVSVGERQ